MKLIDILVEELPKRGGWPEGVSKISSTSCGRVFFDGQSPHGFTLPVASDAWDSHKHPFSYTNAVTREQYEAALAAKNDGWIEWGGGECPLKKGTKVDVKDRDGYEHLGEIIGYNNNVDDIFWRRGVLSCPDNEIIAYRPHQPQEVEQAEDDDEAGLNERIGQDDAPVWDGEGLPPVGCECEFMKHTLDAMPNWRRGIIKYVSEYTVVIVEALSPGEFVAHPRTCEFRPIRSEAERKRDAANNAIAELCRSSASNGHSADLIYDAIAAGEVPGVKLED